MASPAAMTSTFLSLSPSVPSQASLVASSEGGLLSRTCSSPSALAFPSSSSCYPSVRCGRGDKRTAKGKRFLGSHGNCRPKSSKGRARLGLPPTPLPPRPPKKEETREFIQLDIDERLLVD